MKGKWFSLILLLIAIGCSSSKFAMRSERSNTQLQWPFQPVPPKITFVESYQGFTPGSNGARSAFRAITGSNDKQNSLFLLPVAIATSADGRIAIADSGCRCVHLFNPLKNSYKRITGQNRELLESPVGVSFDDAARLFVADSAGKVYAFSSEGAFLFTITAGNNGAMKRPTGVAFNRNRGLLFVVDTLQNQVNAFDRDGKFAFSFGKRGTADGEFNFPTHIFASNAGELYVTDSLNFRIQIFDASGTFLKSFGRHGDGSGDLAMPKGVVVDSDGVVYVVDSLFDNVQLFDSKGELLLILGKRGNSLGEFWLPSGMFLDKNTLYVCDTYNHRIQVFQITEHYSGRV